MMIRVLIGLPGSGKSCLMRELRAQYPDARIFDDFLGSPHVRVLNDDGLFGLIKAVMAGKDVICNDVFLCRPHEREIFARMLGAFCRPDEVRWTYFANDPGMCLSNAVRTDSSRTKTRIGLIHHLAGDYVIPEGAETVPVWAGEVAETGWEPPESSG